MHDYIDYALIDKMAHEYGWTVNYIQTLEPQELAGLCKAIDDREQDNIRILSYVIVLALNGKTWDSVTKNEAVKANINRSHEDMQKDKEQTEKNTQEMLRMFQVLGMPTNQVIDGVKQGKLKF